MSRSPTLMAVALLTAIGCVALSSTVQSSEPPKASEFGADTERLASYGYRVVPSQDLPPAPDARLERSLAALASAVEARRVSEPQAESPARFHAEGLDADIGKVISRLEDRAEISIHVRDLESDAVLFDYFGDNPLNPASNQKLVTSSAALDLLGHDYSFKTRFLVDDKTLYVVGEGDPSLDAEMLARSAQTIADEVAVAELERIVVDDHVFSERLFGPGYAPAGVGHAYQAPSGALSLQFNAVEVKVFPLARGLRPAVSVEPASDHVIVKNSARVAGKHSRINVRTEHKGEDTIVYVSGSMPRSASVSSTRRRIYDPGLHAGGALASMLAGLSHTNKLSVERGRAPDHARVVAVHESASLLEIVDGGLAWSNNFIAEQLIRTIGWRMTGEPGDWVNGSDVVRGYWSALGNDPEQLVFENGSGFSGRGRLTTSGLVDLFSAAHRVQGSDVGLIAALPVAGEEGTLKGRLRHSGKRVRAKSGTLRGVSGLSGVISTEGGEPQVAFSILTNVFEGSMAAAQRRGVEDEIVLTVLAYLDDFESRRGFLQFEPEWISGSLGDVG